MGGCGERVEVSLYTVYITPTALREIKDLPGHMRQLVRRGVSELAREPRPSQSKMLDVAGAEYELRRLRIDRWRIIYAITETDKVIDVLGVRKRPPYDYGDLGRLIAQIE